MLAISIVSVLLTRLFFNNPIATPLSTTYDGVYVNDSSILGNIKYAQIQGNKISLSEVFPASYHNNGQIEVKGEVYNFKLSDRGQIVCYEPNGRIQHYFTILPDDSIIENEGEFVYKKVQK